MLLHSELKRLLLQGQGYEYLPLVKFLNAHLETTFKSEDYLAWSKSYSETEDIDLEVTDFDEAVAYFLGEKAYLYYKKSNQLDDKLKYEVFGY